MDPRTIQLVILAAAFWLPVVALVSMYFFRKLQLQQRLVEIERGATTVVPRAGAPARTRRAGIVCIAAGMGICLGDAIIVAATGDRQAWALQAVGLVPIAVGIGLLRSAGRRAVDQHAAVRRRSVSAQAARRYVAFDRYLRLAGSIFVRPPM